MFADGTGSAPQVVCEPRPFCTVIASQIKKQTPSQKEHSSSSLSCNPFLKFTFDGVVYQNTVLPFGLALALRTVTKCVDAALSSLRQMGVHILNYLDD